MALRKHSLTLSSHRTSISLEEPFWLAFCEIAEARGVSVNALAGQIDATRLDAPQPLNLSSAIRVFVLEQVRQNGG